MLESGWHNNIIITTWASSFDLFRLLQSWLWNDSLATNILSSPSIFNWTIYGRKLSNAKHERAMTNVTRCLNKKIAQIRCPKSNDSSFHFIVVFHKLAQKLTTNTGYFWKKICHWELSKIAQSGHTGAIHPSLSLKFIRSTRVYIVPKPEWTCAFCSCGWHLLKGNNG